MVEIVFATLEFEGCLRFSLVAAWNVATRGRTQLSFAQPSAPPSVEQKNEVIKYTTHQLSELQCAQIILVFFY